MKTDRIVSARLGLVLPIMAVLPLLLVYNFVLIERKYAVLMGRQAFLLAEPMSAIESVLYLIFLPFEISVLVLTCSVLAHALFSRIRAAWRKRAAVAAAFVTLSYFLAITLQFRALQYFKDTVELRVIKKLGGGDLATSLGYVKDELLGLLPLIIGALIAFIAGIWVLRRFGGRLNARLQEASWAKRLVSNRGLLVLNLIALMIPILTCLAFAPLHRALGHSLAHRAYTLPWTYATDFDLDGYSLMTRPRDHAPFDGSRHPYAVEIPGNGIDENGVAGDLKLANWDMAPRPWTANFANKNVILVVLESARAELIQAKVGDKWVMPVLRSAPGHEFRAVSHVAFTSPSVVAILTGTLSEEAKGISMFDRFADRGYKTGVFSAQHEGFGGKAKFAGMDRADRFRDASTEDADARMYPSTTPASLKMPATLMNQRFFEWVDEISAGSRFFAYLNWQEMHFPYSYDGIPTPLVKKLLPRGKISADRKDDLLTTYFNAARVADNAFAELQRGLATRNLDADTIILVIGDHGEELFDDGSLGHGTFLSFEQNETMAKIIGSTWTPPDTPLPLSRVDTVLHNALCQEESSRVALPESVFCYVGSPRTPSQIGIVDGSGFRKYDFYRNQWLRQPARGERFVAMEEDWGIVELWESFVIKRLP